MVPLVKVGDNEPALSERPASVALAAIAIEDDRINTSAVTKNSNLFTMINFATVISSIDGIPGLC